MTMTEEARRARNEYARKWRAEHPESVRAANQRYWERKAEEARAAAAAPSGDAIQSGGDDQSGEV